MVGTIHHHQSSTKWSSRDMEWIYRSFHSHWTAIETISGVITNWKRQCSYANWPDSTIEEGLSAAKFLGNFWPHPPPPPPLWSCFMLLPSPSSLSTRIEGNVWFKHRRVSHYISLSVWCVFALYMFWVVVFVVFDCFSFVLEVHLVFF